MAAKTAKTRSPKFRYAEEDLAPRDVAADEKFVDDFVERNKTALNTSIAEARAAFKRGEYFTLDQAMADVRAQRQRRRARKA